MYQLLLVIVRTQRSEKHHLQALHMRKESAIETRLTFKKKKLGEVSMQAKSIHHCGYMCINGVGATAQPLPPDPLFRFYCVFIRTQSHLVSKYA